MFLHRLELAVDTMDYNSMTRDELVLHLFLSQSDSTMGKQAAEFLQLPQGTQSMAEFRTAVRRIETSPWYGSKSQAKYVGAGAAGAGNTGVDVGTGRYCTACASNTHTTAQCWGECGFCGGRGHKTELCRKKPKDNLETAKLAKAKAENGHKGLLGFLIN